MNSEHSHYGWLKIVGVIVITLCAFGIGLYWGGYSEGTKAGAAERVNLAEFWKVWDLINEKYIPASTTNQISDQDKINGAIKGLVESLGDPYSTFLLPQELKSFEEDIRGNFEGVGMEVGVQDDVLTVVSPLKNTPAEKAGLKPGDKILAINDVSTQGMSVDNAVNLIRGPSGTTVKLTIRRGNENSNREISVVRAVINIPTIETEFRRGDNVFVIRLFNFSAIATSGFRDALKEFALSKSDKLIIDLRNNPGGYLEAAVDIASWFLPAGKIVVQEDFGGDTEGETFRSKGYNVFTDKLKIVVLVNEGSASASEILAGALREHNRALIVGTKTFGKGSVQELIPVSKNSSVKITIARWLTPLGNSISEKGITPDYIVEVTEEDIKAGRDPQLQKAIEVLKAMK